MSVIKSNKDKYYTIREIAEKLKCSTQTVLTIIKTEEVLKWGAIKTKDRIRVSKQAYAFWEYCRKKSSLTGIEYLGVEFFSIEECVNYLKEHNITTEMIQKAIKEKDLYIHPREDENRGKVPKFCLDFWFDEIYED